MVDDKAQAAQTDDQTDESTSEQETKQEEDLVITGQKAREFLEQKRRANAEAQAFKRKHAEAEARAKKAEDALKSDEQKKAEELDSYRRVSAQRESENKKLKLQILALGRGARDDFSARAIAEEIARIKEEDGEKSEAEILEELRSSRDYLFRSEESAQQKKEEKERLKTGSSGAPAHSGAGDKSARIKELQDFIDRTRTSSKEADRIARMRAYRELQDLVAKK